MYDFINSKMGLLVTRFLTTQYRKSSLFCSCSNLSIKTSSSFNFLDFFAIVYALLNDFCVATKSRSIFALTVILEMP